MFFTLFPAVSSSETFVSQILFLWVNVLILGVFFSVIMAFAFSQTQTVFRPFFLEGHSLEAGWTLGPILIIALLAAPTFWFNLCWSTVDVKGLATFSTFMAIGHQWYWEYNTGAFKWDSYTALEGLNRLFSVDHYLFLPSMVPIKLVISSADVIHNFNLPSLSLAIDAVPGRSHSNSTTVLANGLLFGLCSEVCGPGHYSIAIACEVIPAYLWENIFNS